jgi:Na+/H+ antiporter NhaD/arsenite permease-like protein
MVAAKWNWDMHFMAMHFGWKAVLAVVANALVVTFVFRRELGALAVQADSESDEKVPALVVAAHLALLTGVVVFSHHAVVFLGFLLCFLGLAESYPRYQGRLILREGIMVGFFLAGLVILGGPQKWWLQPVLSGMSADALYYGATGLTAFTDNAALTYLGTLVDHLSPEARYALVSGAVTGGGLTVIANAPNPAGFSILQKSFEQGAIHPAGLLLAALPPTAMAIIAFRLF